jgi:hypothetical protein
VLPTCHACQLDKHFRFHFTSSVTKDQDCLNLFILICRPHLYLLWVAFAIIYCSRMIFLIFHGCFHYVSSLMCLPFFCNFRAYSFQCDNGRNTIIRYFSIFVNKMVHNTLSCPHTSQQNGKAKRTIRTINNITRTLLFQAFIPPKFLVEALNMVVHVLNLLPTTTLSLHAPFEVLFGFFPTYTHLCVFR